jgi:nucleotide-binding universal stress UspA family protein
VVWRACSSGPPRAAIAGDAHCPVVVLPDEDTVAVDDRRSVVVGVDGRCDDEPVLDFAFAEAAARGTDLIAVHAWPDAVLDTAIRSTGPMADWTGVQDDERRLLSERLAGAAAAEGPDVVVREVVVRDRPARALVAAATTAQLLVVGHHSRRAFGSTTHAVLHRSTCPVAVVPLAKRG